MKNNYVQYISDVYHCSEEWGQKVTEEDMKASLEEWSKEAAPGEYVPDITLFKQCAAVWNGLCEAYPAQCTHRRKIE